MAKQLRSPLPSSSIVRLLDMQAAANAVAKAPATPRPPPEVLPPSRAAPFAGACVEGAEVTAQHETMTPPLPSGLRFVKREVVLTPETDEAFTRLIDLYRRTTGTRLSASHIARAMLRAVAFAMPSVEHEAARLGPMKLPSNARGRALERERFEARLADALLAGLIGSGKEPVG